MTESECAVERLLNAIKRETVKPDCYVPQTIVSAYLDVINLRKHECAVCGNSSTSPQEPG